MARIATGLSALLVISSAGAQPTEKDRAPELTGQLLFHRYRAYEAWDSELYLFDLAEKSLTCLSADWPVDHAMNAQFSPDGKRIVFMAVPRGKHERSRWDVYVWEVARKGEPKNLTFGDDVPDEDARFSPDGKSIVFKRDGRIALMNLDGKNGRFLPGLEPGIEYSMPLLSADGRRVVTMAGARADGDLYAFAVRGGARTTIAATPRVQEYYPVPWSAESLLYVRWLSDENHNDQIYRYSWRDRASTPLPFNRPDSNASDPAPLDDRWIIFSSTRAGGKGGYDLYVGNASDGSVKSLDFAGINTKSEELGACYRGRQATK